MYARYLNTYVIDCLPIIHTRSVGSGDGIIHSRGIFDAQHFPQIDPNRMKNLQNYKTLEDLLSDNKDYLQVDSAQHRLYYYQKHFEFWRQRKLNKYCVS
jgi:hypothetical protein